MLDYVFREKSFPIINSYGYQDTEYQRVLTIRYENDEIDIPLKELKRELENA